MRSYVFLIVFVFSTALAQVSTVGSFRPWVDTQHHTKSDMAALKDVLNGKHNIALTWLPERISHPKLLYLPLGTYPVVVGYNLPNVQISLSVATLCKMFMGEVLEWRSINPNLPHLPILSIAQTSPNPASWVLSQQCSYEHPAWRKNIGLNSSWQSKSIIYAKNLPEQNAHMQTLGSLSLYVASDVPENVQIARISNNTFQNARYGYYTPYRYFPSPWTALPQPNIIGTYPLRGLIWGIMLQEQSYQGRNANDVTDMYNTIKTLQITEGKYIRSLPTEWQFDPVFYFSGKVFKPEK